MAILWSALTATLFSSQVYVVHLKIYTYQHKISTISPPPPTNKELNYITNIAIFNGYSTLNNTIKRSMTKERTKLLPLLPL